MKLIWHLDFGFGFLQIIPAIIAKNFNELKEKIRLVEPYVNWVQLDIMDGVFVSEKTWPYFAEASQGKPYFDKELGNENEPEKLKEIGTKVNIEAHLMVSEPEKELGKWLDSGVKRILAHWEALTNEKLKVKNEKPQIKIQNLIKKCSENGIEFGLVLNLKTPISLLNELPVTSYQLPVIQLMSIGKIGYHGQAFDEKVIHKIETLKRKWPDVKISIDGGLNSQNVLAAAEVGADNLVIGSAIYQSQDIGKTIQELKEKLKIN